MKTTFSLGLSLACLLALLAQFSNEARAAAVIDRQNRIVQQNPGFAEAADGAVVFKFPTVDGAIVLSGWKTTESATAFCKMAGFKRSSAGTTAQSTSEEFSANENPVVAKTEEAVTLGMHGEVAEITWRGTFVGYFSAFVYGPQAFTLIACKNE